MVATPFLQQQKDISDAIHLEYRDTIYPALFRVNKEAITYDDIPDELKQLADWFLALDGAVNVKHEGLPNTLRWTFSYRFRDAERFQSFQDLTITAHNDASNQPGEFSKMAVDYFTYGYYSPPPRRLVEVVVIRLPDLKRAIATNRITSYGDLNPRSNQPFEAYKFRDLKRLGIMCLHFKEVNGVFIPQSIMRQVNIHASLEDGMKRVPKSYNPRVENDR